MKIGYVGLGNMGAALARRLQLQYPLFVYDLNEAAVERMVEKGSTACSSPRDVASQSDVILLCLPTSDHVRAAIFGENGLAAALKPGSLIVDQTTGDPIATRAIAADLGKRGGLMHKDVRLACQLGSDSGVPMFFGNLAREFYQMCITELGSDAQVHSAALIVDRIAGTQVVPPGSQLK